LPEERGIDLSPEGAVGYIKFKVTKKHSGPLLFIQKDWLFDRALFFQDR